MGGFKQINPGDTGVLANIKTALDEAQNKRLQRDNCGYTGNLPQVYFVTVRKIALGGAKPDIYVKFPQPINQLWVASKDNGHLPDSLYFHFITLGKRYTGNAIDPDGSENWFDLTYTADGGTRFKGKFLWFDTPFIDGYLDIGQEAGGGDYNLTLAGCYNQIREMSSTGIAVGA